jgi:hypothetical protein
VILRVVDAHVNPAFLKNFFPKKFSVGEGVVMSGFTMKTAGVFLALLSQYKGAHGARGGAPEGKRNGNYRHGACTYRALAPHQIAALTSTWKLKTK